jgi:hypothetical protein
MGDVYANGTLVEAADFIGTGIVRAVAALGDDVDLHLKRGTNQMSTPSIESYWYATANGMRLELTDTVEILGKSTRDYRLGSVINTFAEFHTSHCHRLRLYREASEDTSAFIAQVYHHRIRGRVMYHANQGVDYDGEFGELPVGKIENCLSLDKYVAKLVHSFLQVAPELAQDKNQ